MKAAALLLTLALASGADKKDAPLLAGRDVALPVRVSGAPPAYPAMARDVGLQAMIVLQVTLSPEGKPTGIKVLRGVPLLDAAAIDAVKAWRYEPTVIDGAPQRVDVVEAIPFFSSEDGLFEAFSRLATDRALPSHLRVEAVSRLATAPPKSRKSMAKALEKILKDPDEAVSKAAAGALSVMGTEVR